VKIGDLVRYRGWFRNSDIGKHFSGPDPIGIIVEQNSEDDDFHHRVRVMWVGEELPVQARVLSTSGNRITTWVHPKHFEVINESR